MPNLHDRFWSTQKDLQWEKCSRFLLTLESAALLDLQECVKKIANNIIANPREPKYTRLRYENETLQAKIFRNNGGLAVMRGFGFEFEDTSKIPADKLDGQKYLVLSPDALSGLPACVQWLDETVETAMSFIAAKHEEAEAEAEAERQRQNEGDLSTTVFEAVNRVRIPMPDIPAQALISIELPTRERVLGGFCLGDTVYGVRRFAAAFFRVQCVEDIILRLPEDLQFDLDAVRVGNNEDAFDATLEETNWPTIEDMQWYPRMRILAYSRVATKAYTNDDSSEQQFGEARLVQAHLQRHAQAETPSSAPLNAFSSSATTLLTPQERAERVRKLQAQVRANQLQVQKEREDAIRNFHEDRERVKKVRPTIPLKDTQDEAGATSPTANVRSQRMALWRRRPAPSGTSASAPAAASKSSSSSLQQPRTRR